jgi:hypothetical protein
VCGDKGLRSSATGVAQAPIASLTGRSACITYTSQSCAGMRGSCRVQRSGESVWLVALTRIKVIHSGIHLVLKDAIRGPAWCPADDEHAPAANIDPDGIRLIGGSSAHWPARRTAGPSLAPPTHRGHLRRFTRPALTSTVEPVTTTMAAAGTTRRCFGQRSIVPPSRAGPSDGCRLWRHRACQLRVPASRNGPLLPRSARWRPSARLVAGPVPSGCSWARTRRPRRPKRLEHRRADILRACAAPRRAGLPHRRCRGRARRLQLM